MKARSWSEHAFSFFILAVIFGAFFFLVLIQGIKLHWGGNIEMAFMFYLVATILAGMAKVCTYEIRMDLEKTHSPRRSPRRKR